MGAEKPITLSLKQTKALGSWDVMNGEEKIWNCPYFMEAHAFMLGYSRALVESLGLGYETIGKEFHFFKRYEQDNEREGGG